MTVPCVLPRRSVLYLMHVDWGWIRQRPHHLAEGLAIRNEVEVLYPWSWRRSALVRNDSPVVRRAVPQVPLRRRARLAAAADEILKAWVVRRAMASRRPDVVWLTHPRLERLLPDPLPSGTALVYDCMDDASAFPELPLERQGIAEAEARLARRATLTFASSARLAALLSGRGFRPERVEVLRNGAGRAPCASRPPRARAPGAPLRAAYFGTIAPWIDFDALLAALEAIPALTVTLVGPREVPVPPHPRLRAPGPVPHERLAGLAEEADVLLVPFKRTPLIEAVDPIKVYEYVAFGRDIVCLRWPESEKFKAFATLYDTSAELISALASLARGGSARIADSADREAFIRQNSWAARVAQAEAALARVEKMWGLAS